MRIQQDEASVSWAEVSELFRLAGWGIREADELRDAFARSSFKAFAFEEQNLVGFARTIDDGRFYATIVDVIVAPAHQGRGVGSALVRDLQQRLEGFLFVTLTAVPGVQPFYRRLGWRPQTTAMLLPHSPAQAQQYTSDD